MTTGSVSQGGLIVVGEVSPSSVVSQAGLIVVAEIQPGSGVSQAGLIVIASAAPCSTRRCSLWSIHRKDGQVLRFTSHDRDVQYGAGLYLTCGSLQESASEQSADQSDVGSVELSGIIDSEHISDEDLYAGLYDDAFIQVWRVSWDDPTDHVHRIAAGWAGKVSQGERGFQVEVLGPGARALQQPLLQTVTPGCRWKFGDPNTCGFDREGAAITGTVATASARSFFTAAIVDPGGVHQWARGTVRWTYGRNTGTECEVSSVDFATGEIILAIVAGFIPEAGDSFDLLPGCDLSDAHCKALGNYLNNGGFPFVPGQDFVAQTPDEKA